MATVTQTLYLQDKMSNTLSKVQQNALNNIKTFNKMSDEVDSLKKALEEAEKVNPKIVETEMYLQASQALEDMEGKLYDVANGETNVKDNSDNMNKSMTEVNQTLELLNKGWQVLSGVMQEANQWMEMSNNQFNSEFGAAIKLHNVLGATQEEITSMYDYASALQQVGVVGDEATLAGVNQLSVYADNLDQINTLTPAILDLAVAQNGLDTSQSNVESSAMMVGRALNGTTMMLKRQLGLTDEQVKALDAMNDKNEKAAALFELIEQKTGGANQALAQTAQGGIMQANNALGDLQEKLGTQVVPYFEMFERLLVQILTPIVNWASANSDWLVPSLIAVAGGLGTLIAVLTVYQVIGWLTAGVNWAIVAPLLILVGLIVAFVVAINLAAQALSEWSGTSVSAIGLVFGAVNVAITAVENLFIDLFNILQGIIDGIVLLFLGLANTVMTTLNAIATGIDAVFGSNLASATSGLLDKINSAGAAIIEDPGFIERKSYSDAFTSGYDKGSTMFEGINPSGASTFDMNKMFSNVSGINNNLDGLVGTGKGGGKALKTTSDDNLLSDEDIQLLLDVATRDYQLNYQQMTPNISVSFGDVRETADVDAVMDQLGDRIDEFLNGDGEVKN